MAPFNKEPENEVQPELSVKPRSPPVPAASVPQPSPSAEGKVAPLRQGAPAPLEGCAYLDQGSKVSGKLNFEGPARIVVLTIPSSWPREIWQPASAWSV
jgi:hypothetical protein